MKDRSSVFYCLKASALSASILQSIFNYTYLHPFLEMQRIFVEYSFSPYDETGRDLVEFMTILATVIRGKRISLLIKIDLNKTTKRKKIFFFLTVIGYICAILGIVGVLRVSKTKKFTHIHRFSV